MKKYLSYILLGIIILGAIFLRIYKLNQIPPSLDWDEASFSYNAYTIANWGKDEWGRNFPLSFESFGEYKNPVDIYITVPFVKLFGLNEFTTRLPAAIFGIANVVLIYFLIKLLFKSEAAALAGSFFLAISPYDLQFSRHHHELNIALFFFMLGVPLFYKAIRNHGKRFWISIVCFCLSMLTYNAAKLVVPLAGLFLAFLYRKKLWEIKKQVLWGVIPLAILGIMFLTNKNLTGLSRFKQASVSDQDIYNTYLYKATKNRRLGRIEIILRQYPWHFSYKYLFGSGDAQPRHSIQTVGEFYKTDIVFLILGFGYLIYIFKKKPKESLFILFWALVAPLPSALSSEAPHAARSMFMVGSWHIVAALGFAFLIGFAKSKYLKAVVLGAALIAIGFCFGPYLKEYYRNYSTRYAIDWQYGMKQIVSYLQKQKNIDAVYMTKERSQPYIFFLYYLKTPLPEYLATVKPNSGEDSGANRVLSFGKYHFGGWNTVESFPNSGVYYVLTPTEYSGLRYLSQFTVKKLIKYPNGSDAFYIVTAEE